MTKFTRSKIRYWVAISVMALFATIDSSATLRPRARMDKEVQAAVNQGGNAKVRVIVRTNRGSRAALRTAFGLRANFKIKREMGRLSALAMELPQNAIDGMLRTPGVLSVSIDAPIQGQQAVMPITGELLQQTLGVPASGHTGAGVGIAIVDSGIAPSADFGSRITAFYDFTQGGISTQPYDDYGHGTHVAGLAAGSGAMSSGLYKGVAPDANLIGLKVLTGAGGGYTSDVIAAIEFATANKAALGIDIMNLSLGHPPFEPAATDPLVEAVDNASAAGIVMIVSAGNVGTNPTTGIVGYGGILSPGNARSAITVGSADTNYTVERTDDRIMPYSSRGPSWFEGYAKPDVIAPGHRLAAPAAPGAFLPTTYPNLVLSNGNYLRLTGTSMAAAVT